VNDGLLVLEDGTFYRGRTIGKRGTFFGEIVFNTSMTGFQEILTDPSYLGQLVVMTASHIGNYGARGSEAESGRVQAAGFLSRDFPSLWSGAGGGEGIANLLERSGVPGFFDFDSRSLVRRLRSGGVMRAAISTEVEDPEELRRRVLDSPQMEGAALALTAGTDSVYTVPASGPERYHVAAVDYGVKRSLLSLLAAVGAKLTVFPARASAREILDSRPVSFFPTARGIPRRCRSASRPSRA
jgi:carbamoyl-phosphate synthase small subunit